MRIVYFELSNGKVVPPRLICPAAWYAVINWKFEIVAIRSCFSLANIERNGEEWKNKLLNDDQEHWSNYSWLMPSLKDYIRANWWKILTKKKWNEVLDEKNYKYYTAWIPEYRRM